jgi:hypothetical protein
LLTSCGKTLNCVDKPRADPKQEPFKNVRVEVGVDGSGSMYGFVSRPGTRYSQAIDSLNTLLSTKGIPTSYWRIGRGENVDKPQPLSASEFLQARTPGFYECRLSQSTFPCVTSTLDQIYTLPVEDPKQKVLKVLITDLEPDSAAVGQLSGQISAQLRENPDYKAVLLGVRSHFQGQVFPAMTGAFQPFQYSTEGKDVDLEGRPFFVLITGPTAAVDVMVADLRELPLNVSQAFRASSFAIGGIDAVALDKNSIPQKLGSCVAQTGAIKGVRPSRTQYDQWLLLEQECAVTEPLPLELTSEKAVILSGAKLTPELFTVSNPAVKLQQIQVNQDQLKLGVTLEVEQIPKKSGQEIYITLQKKTLDKAVWGDWDMAISQPSGAKTQNLALFVSGLRGAVEGVVQNPKQKAATQEAVKYCLGFTRHNE